MSASAIENLTLANQIRVASAHWRRDVFARPSMEGRLTLAETLEGEDIPREIGMLRLRRYLMSANRLGERMASHICREAGIARRDPRVRDLTVRERMALAAALRRRVGQA